MQLQADGCCNWSHFASPSLKHLAMDAVGYPGPGLGHRPTHTHSLGPGLPHSREGGFPGPASQIESASFLKLGYGRCNVTTFTVIFCSSSYGA